MAEQEDRISRVARGVRFDLVIAMFALLISTLAAGASWWQARIVQNQTLILQEQLGAQVWPYVSLSENISGDRAELSTTNDGLGPAVLRSATALVDGVPRSNFIEILHAILGPNLVARKPHGQRMSIDIGSASPGTVLRPDRSTLDFVLISKRFAPPSFRELPPDCASAFATARSFREGAGSATRSRTAIRSPFQLARRSQTTCCMPRQSNNYSTANSRGAYHVKARR